MSRRIFRYERNDEIPHTIDVRILKLACVDSILLTLPLPHPWRHCFSSVHTLLEGEPPGQYTTLSPLPTPLSVC